MDPLTGCQVLIIIKLLFKFDNLKKGLNVIKENLNNYVFKSEKLYKKLAGAPWHACG